MAKQPAPPTRMVRRGRGHSYMLDGTKAPGVTTIINDGVPKPALVGWAARTVAEYVVDRLALKDGTVFADELVESLRAFNDSRKFPEKLGAGLPRIGLTKILAQVQYADRDAAANRGTEVHALAEQLARGEEIVVPAELAGHVEAYVRFLDECQPANAILERPVISRRYKYMGKFDMIADFPFTPIGNGRVSLEPSRALLDVKTSRSGPFEDVALQLAGYRYAETMLVDDAGAEEPMPEVDWCGVIWVRADGYDLIPFEVDEKTHRVFLYAKQVGWWLDRENGGCAGIKGDVVRPPALEAVAS